MHVREAYSPLLRKDYFPHPEFRLRQKCFWPSFFAGWNVYPMLLFH